MHAKTSLLAAVIVGLWGPSTANAQASAASGPDQPITLKDAMSRALSNNLDLRVSRADTGFAQAELVGSRLRPNPSLAVEYLTTRDGRASLTQDLQLWGVRGYRIRAARCS